MTITPTRDRVNPEKVNTAPLRRPEWIRVRAPAGETYERLQVLMRSKALHTVCEKPCARTWASAGARARPPS
jgi:lipoic acid synthetase